MSHAWRMRGKAEVPVGWADLADALLETVAEPRREGFGGSTCDSGGCATDSLRASRVGGDEFEAGAAAFVAEMSKRLDHATGTNILPALGP